MKRLILLIIAVVSFQSCSKIVNTISAVRGEDYVTMRLDDVLYEQSNSNYIESRFWLRKSSFSFYLNVDFDGTDLVFNVSSEDKFEYDKWYPIPTEATENAWESFFHLARTEIVTQVYDVKTGWVKFTKKADLGRLNMYGQGVCTVNGEFKFTAYQENDPEVIVEITKGKFLIPMASYWDSRAME